MIFELTWPHVPVACRSDRLLFWWSMTLWFCNGYCEMNDVHFWKELRASANDGSGYGNWSESTCKLQGQEYNWLLVIRAKSALPLSLSKTTFWLSAFSLCFSCESREQRERERERERERRTRAKGKPHASRLIASTSHGWSFIASLTPLCYLQQLVQLLCPYCKSVVTSSSSSSSSSSYSPLHLKFQPDSARRTQEQE